MVVTSPVWGGALLLGLAPYSFSMAADGIRWLTSIRERDPQPYIFTTLKTRMISAVHSRALSDADLDWEPPKKVCRELPLDPFGLLHVPQIIAYGGDGKPLGSGDIRWIRFRLDYPRDALHAWGINTQGQTVKQTFQGLPKPIRGDPRGDNRLVRMGTDRVTMTFGMGQPLARALIHHKLRFGIQLSHLMEVGGRIHQLDFDIRHGWLTVMPSGAPLTAPLDGEVVVISEEALNAAVSLGVLNRETLFSRFLVVPSLERLELELELRCLLGLCTLESSLRPSEMVDLLMMAEHPDKVFGHHGHRLLGESHKGGTISGNPGVYRHCVALDFRSMYPWIISQHPELSPNHLGSYAVICERLMDQRAEWTKAGMGKKADAAKLLANEVYGILSLYYPHLAGEVTRYGRELLAEMVSRVGLPLALQNTDGAYFHSVPPDHAALNKAIAHWGPGRLRVEQALDLMVVLNDRAWWGLQPLGSSIYPQPSSFRLVAKSLYHHNHGHPPLPRRLIDWLLLEAGYQKIHGKLDLAKLWLRLLDQLDLAFREHQGMELAIMLARGERVIDPQSARMSGLITQAIAQGERPIFPGIITWLDTETGPMTPMAFVASMEGSSIASILLEPYVVEYILKPALNCLKPLLDPEAWRKGCLEEIAKRYKDVRIFPSPLMGHFTQYFSSPPM